MFPVETSTTATSSLRVAKRREPSGVRAVGPPVKNGSKERRFLYDVLSRRADELGALVGAEEVEEVDCCCAARSCWIWSDVKTWASAIFAVSCYFE